MKRISTALVLGLVATLLIGTFLIALAVFAQSGGGVSVPEFLLITVLLLVTLLVVGRRFARGRPSPASQQPNEMYLGLRKLALETSPTMIGLPSDLASSQPYGILMEIGLSNGVATLTSFVSGDASLYFSRGGGILGGIADESIHNAAKRFVTLAASYVDRMETVESYPLPAVGQIRFYVLTAQGIRTAEAQEKELVSKRSEFSPLFYAGQEVITAIRLYSARRTQ